MLLDKDFAQFFDKEEKGYEDARYFYMTNLRAQIIKTAIPDDSILDLGCNCGHLIQKYMDPLKHKVTGVDTSGKSIEVAKKLVPEASFFVSNANNLLFDEGQFDSIVCSEILYYLVDPLNFN